MDNVYIQSEADDLLRGTLRKLLSNRNYLLGEFEANQKYDKGIDYFFEVFNEKKEHLFLFLNQNKGTSDRLKKIKRRKDENFGKISYQLDDLRHADYFYYQLEDPLIFTLCDLKEKKVFWYDIQNDYSLPERIIKQKEDKKGSIQIYIPTENILNEETLERLLAQIQYSKYNQVRKKKAVSENIQADYSKTDENVEGKHIIDKIIHTLKLFEGIMVLPTDVICQLSPFKGTKERTYINESNLYTDNEEFFDFMSSIQVDKEGLRLKSNFIYVENQSNKLIEIINFFQANYILHIKWGGKNPKNKTCLHYLFQYKKCDCERCNLERLNYKRAIQLLTIEKHRSNYELLRKGYTYYLLGDYISSARVFLEIYNTANKAANPINFTISTYNLIKLRRLIKFSHNETEENDLIQKLELVKFDNDEGFIKQYAPHFIDIYADIKERRFYDNVRYSTDEHHIEIQKFFFEDRHGARHSQNRYDELESSYLRFSSYLKHNFIIFSHYREYEDLSKKLLENFLALSTLKNPNNQKNEKFDRFILEMWIFNIDEDYSRYLIKKYTIKKIEINEKSAIVEWINELLDNLISSKNYLGELTGLFKPIKPQKTLSNVVLISGLINITLQEKLHLISKVLDFCDSIDDIYCLPGTQLINFANEYGDLLNKTILKRILDALFLDNSWNYGLGRTINKYVDKCDKPEILRFIKAVLKVDSVREIDFDRIDNTYLDYLFYSFTLLNNSPKSIIKSSIKKALFERFDGNLYDKATIFDLIDFDSNLFKKFVESVPDMSNIEEQRSLFGNYENIKINQVINIAYKYGLEFDKELKQLCNKANERWKDYYVWLMDIDGFDYNKFNHYWILEYGTVYYYERFRKSERLKKEIIKALSNDYIEGVAKVYFKHIV